MRTLRKRSVLPLSTLATCAALALFLTSHNQAAGLVTAEGGAININDPWSPGDLMQPQALAALLAGKTKPVVFQVGIVHLYKMAHIPGSKYAGPANEAGGLDALKRQAHGLDRNRQIVCYCGCCPWGDCPNTRPAYQTLREMGFKKISMLYLPNNFGQDWSAKGYPVEKGN
jgi:thiosulfate/3-mercaptopyruvate sulfurtransferase